MTRRWGRAVDAWTVALVQRQVNKGMDGQTCECCMKHEDEHGVKTLIVAHPNGYNPTKIPTLDELALWHQSCNIKALSKFPGVIPLIERERALRAQKYDGEAVEGKASSSEKAAAEKMRPRWNQWIAGRITRPSMLDHPCQLWNNAMLGIREWGDLASVTQRAPAACELGSSKTYWVYGLEDIQAGKLEKETAEGKVIVRYNPDFAGLVAANLKSSLEKFKEAPKPESAEKRTT